MSVVTSMLALGFAPQSLQFPPSSGLRLSMTPARAAAPPLMAARREHLALMGGAVTALLGRADAASAASPKADVWSFSDLLDAVDKGKVEKASFAPDGKQVLVIDVDGNRHESLILADQTQDLVRTLTKKGVTFAVQPQQGPEGAGGLAQVLPALGLPLLIIGGLFFLQRRNQENGGGGGMGGMGGPGGVMNLGKSKSKIQMEPETGVTFEDVAGCEGSKQELTEIVEFLKNPSKYSALGAKIPRGAVMEGPPGTGKTLLARAVAGEAGVPFISASGSEFVEMFVGVGASRVRDLFGEAKKNAPCIVFIDEIDAVGRARAAGGGGMGGGNDEREQTLNQILTEMDGFEGNSGVIVLAATNRADVLDSALLRPGRFDRRVPVDLPDTDGRLDILKVHCRGKPLDPALELEMVARRTTGFSGASLANLMNEAAIVAARNGKTEISYDEIDYAIDRIQVGMVKSTGTSFPNRQRLVAYHEAGHAIMGVLTPGADQVAKVTILPRTNGAGGFTLFAPSEERLSSGLYTKRYLEGQLAIALAGRVVEEIVYGAEEITTGASNDLQQVRNIARNMVTKWGYSGESGVGGMVAWEMDNGAWYGPKAASAETEVAIDAEIKQLVAKAYAHCKETLIANRELVEDLTEMLIEKETVDYKEMQELVDKYHPNGIPGADALPAGAL